MQPALSWLILLSGTGYLFVSIASRMLHKPSSVVDFAGAMMLMIAGTIGLTHPNEAGWFFTLALAGLVVGIFCFAASLKRWATH